MSSVVGRCSEGGEEAETDKFTLPGLFCMLAKVFNPIVETAHAPTSTVVPAWAVAVVE